MEHEVFVPVAVQTLRDLLADPARIARCVPGLQQDAEATAGPLSGRLRVRVGGQTITYRGALHIVARDDGSYTVEGEGAEARGSGGAKLALTLWLAPAEGGTTLAFSGTLRAEGRLAEVADGTATAAAHRLLDRFSESLAETEESAQAEDAAAMAATVEAAEAAAAAEEGVFDDDGVDDGVDEGVDDGVDDGAEEVVDAEVEEEIDEAGADLVGDTDGEPGPTVFDASVPPSFLDPFAVDDFPLDETVSDEPPAEAAHARRTMIGRSAEEVDHAPPRGRYAPVPGPATITTSSTLRWLAPAAALALASAVVVGRALRRRK